MKNILMFRALKGTGFTVLDKKIYYIKGTYKFLLLTV